MKAYRSVPICCEPLLRVHRPDSSTPELVSNASFLSRDRPFHCAGAAVRWASEASSWHSAAFRCKSWIKPAYNGRGAIVAGELQVADRLPRDRTPQTRHEALFGIHAGLSIITAFVRAARSGATTSCNLPGRSSKSPQIRKPANTCHFEPLTPRFRIAPRRLRL
jgi:hypothetical protein